MLSELAEMAELVDALVSGISGATRGGSSPLLGTKFKNQSFVTGFFMSKIHV